MSFIVHEKENNKKDDKKNAITNISLCHYDIERTEKEKVLKLWKEESWNWFHNWCCTRCYLKYL